MLFYHSFKENDCVVTEIPCYNKVRADIRETVNELNPNAVLPECWPYSCPLTDINFRIYMGYNAEEQPGFRHNS